MASRVESDEHGDQVVLTRTESWRTAVLENELGVQLVVTYSIDTEHQAPLVSALAGRSCWYVHLRVERRRMLGILLEGCVECVGGRYCWCILLSFDDVHIHFALSSHQSVSGSLCPRAAAIKC